MMTMVMLWNEPVDNEEAEEDDEGHGEEDGAVVDIFPQAKLPHQLGGRLVRFMSFF